MSASGRFVAVREGARIAVIDVQGTAPRRTLAGGADFVIAGAASLVVADGGELRVEPLDGNGRAAASLAIGAARVAPFWGRAASAVMADDAIVALEPKLAASGEVRGGFPLHGRAVLDATALAIVTSGRSAPLGADAAAAVAGGELRDAVPLFAGRSLALVVEQRGGGEVVIVLQHGAVVHRISIGAPRWRAFAPERGLLLVGGGDDAITTIDLRMGRVASCGRARHAVDALAIDEAGRTIAILAPDGAASVIRLDALEPVERSPAEEPGAAEPPPSEPAPPTLAPTNAVPPPRRLSPVEDDAIAALPLALPLALGAPLVVPAPPAASASDAAPFADASEHLAALLDLVAARAGAAIADGWHTGRISADAAGHHPFEREVRALSGAAGAHAAAQVADARALLVERAEGIAARVHATLAAGTPLPFVELGREYALTPLALQIFVGVLAPTARGEIARLYRILGNESGRPMCDETLTAMLLGGERDAIAFELAAHAPLVRHGLVRRDHATGGLDVDPVLVARLRGQPVDVRAGERRYADRALEDLVIDRAQLRALVLELADPRPVHAPLRLVVRGRRGSGRHALVAALAARLGRAIACIDASQLSLDELARELTRAALVRAVPVVSNLELRRTGEHERDRDHARAVRGLLREHPGPLAIRTSAGGEVPLDPGFVEIALPPLSESARAAVSASALAAAGLAADAARLAARFRVSAGTVYRIAADARRRVDASADRELGARDAIVADCARQHLAARIGSIAQRVTRLADWDQVALPDDMLDSLRELIGRARHARTVFEDWGYDDRIATSRGLTALFYGPPGTGKTMVAGLVARELGLELYRVDLAKVMSKWLGETEKNLGELFDAAEDGQIMLLFDEADSLFAKRSEVRSSNDRYANLEVNYLLQRLDAFEGVAILTTNLDGSLDPAFKRRMAMRLLFPFPDEEQRARLWAAHVTTRIPTRGVLDFAALARRFPLSGGYIRNSALRAAFLAAQEGSPLTHQHLERAVLLEYRELGKLAEGGRVD